MSLTGKTCSQLPASPSLAPQPLNIVAVEHLGASLPGGFGQIHGIAHLKGMPRGYLIDVAAGLLDLAHGRRDPHILQRVGYGSEDLANPLRARGRLFGSGKWVRGPDGEWLLSRFNVDRFQVLEEEALS